MSYQISGGPLRHENCPWRGKKLMYTVLTTDYIDIKLSQFQVDGVRFD